MGADETQIEASFCEAIRIAKEQKSISLEKRAEGTYAEYQQTKSERVQEDVDSDYRCGDCLQRRTYGSRASVGLPADVAAERRLGI